MKRGWLYYCIKEAVELQILVCLSLTFGPEGPEIPGGPCNPRMPL